MQGRGPCSVSDRRLASGLPAGAAFAQRGTSLSVDPDGLRRDDGPHDPRSVAVVLRVVRGGDAVRDLWSRHLERDVALHATGPDPTLAGAERRWNHGLS